MAGDVLRGASATITWQSLTGAALVIVGFGLMGLEGWEEGMANRVPIVAPILTDDDEEGEEEDGYGVDVEDEGSVFSIESDVHRRVESSVGSERYRLGRGGSTVTRDTGDVAGAGRLTIGDR